MTLFELKEQLFDIINVKKRIRAGEYNLSPIKKVKIPKLDGGTRILGVLTAVDYMIQQAVAQVLAHDLL